MVVVVVVFMGWEEYGNDTHVLYGMSGSGVLSCLACETVGINILYLMKQLAERCWNLDCNKLPIITLDDVRLFE